MFALFVRTRVIEAGDAAGTAANLRASAALVLGVLLIVGGLGYLAGVLHRHPRLRRRHRPGHGLQRGRGAAR